MDSAAARPTISEVVEASRPMFESRGAAALHQFERVDEVLADGWWADLGVALQKLVDESKYPRGECGNREVNIFIAGLTVGLEFVIDGRGDEATQ